MPLEGHWVVLLALLACCFLPILHAKEWLLNPLIGLVKDVGQIFFAAGALLGLILLIGLSIAIYERLMSSSSIEQHADEASQHAVYPIVLVFGATAIGGWILAYAFGLTSPEEWPAAITTLPLLPAEPTSYKALSFLVAIALFIAVGGISFLKGGYEEDKAKRRELRAQRKAEKARRKGL